MRLGSQLLRFRLHSKSTSACGSIRYSAACSISSNSKKIESLVSGEALPQTGTPHPRLNRCGVKRISTMSVCGAYVGERTSSATEYHSNDFDWEELRAEVEARLAEQRHDEGNNGISGEFAAACSDAIIDASLQWYMETRRCISGQG